MYIRHMGRITDIQTTKRRNSAHHNVEVMTKGGNQDHGIRDKLCVILHCPPRLARPLTRQIPEMNGILDKRLDGVQEQCEAL